MACLNTDLCLKVEVNLLVEQNKMALPSVVLLVPNTNYLFFFFLKLCYNLRKSITYTSTINTYILI